MKQRFDTDDIDALWAMLQDGAPGYHYRSRYDFPNGLGWKARLLGDRSCVELRRKVVFWMANKGFCRRRHWKAELAAKVFDVVAEDMTSKQRTGLRLPL